MRSGLRLCVLLGVLAFPSVPAPTLHAQAIPRTLKIAIAIEPDTLDPAAVTAGPVMNIMDYMYERLIVFDYTQNRILPRLAAQWQVSSDGLTYTFRLRGGVAFHDGTPVTADAVKFTFDRLLDPRTRATLRDLYFTALQETQVVDPMTVRFVLSRRDSVFLMGLTHWIASIVSPAAVRRSGENFTRDPTGAGTGPYAFKEWMRGTHIQYLRNPAYWGRKPVFEEVLLRTVPAPGVRETMLLAGDAHVALLPPAVDVRRLRERAGFTVVEGETSRAFYVGMNTQWGPFKDTRVRRAMNHAVNKRAILTSVLFDLGTILDSPCVSVVARSASVQPGGWPFDPGRARQLLKEAGYAEGFEAEFMVGVGRQEIAHAIAAQFRNINVRANIRPVDTPTYLATIFAPPDRSRLQLFMGSWVPFPLDCRDVLYPMFHSAQHPSRGSNATLYQNAEVDRRLDRTGPQHDPASGRDLLREAQTIVWNDAPWVFLWSAKLYLATTRNLHGVSITPFEMFDAIYATWK